MGSSVASNEHEVLRLSVLRIPVFRPLRWLRLGWNDLRKSWGGSLGYGALILAFGWTLLIFCATHPYLVAAAITGFLLVGPLMSAGLCEISRRFSMGLSANFDDSLDGFVRNRVALFEFGVILAVCAAAWFIFSALLLGTVFDVAAPDVRETLYHVFAYIAVGGILAASVFAVSVVAIPLIVDRHATAQEAMRASLRVAVRNVPAMIVWSALILALTIVGYASLLLGLLFIAPLLGHATWHAYKDAID
jgi:uncharacterized membrane protein